MKKIKGTLGNVLYKIQVQRKVAVAKARADILKRNNLKEEEIDGLHWRLEEQLDTRAGAADLIEFKLYKLEDATAVFIEGKVRIDQQDGIENLPSVKNQPPF